MKCVICGNILNRKKGRGPTHPNGKCDRRASMLAKVLRKHSVE